MDSKGLILEFKVYVLSFCDFLSKMEGKMRIITNETLVDIAGIIAAALYMRGWLKATPGTFSYKLKCMSEATPENYRKSSMLV